MNRAAVILGNTLSLFGVCLSVEQLDKVSSIVTIVIGVLGFILSVVVPNIVKVAKKIKKAKEDGKVTIDEIEDIANTMSEGIEDIKENIPNKESHKDNE